MAVLALTACAPLFSGDPITSGAPDGTYVTITWPAAGPGDEVNAVSRYQVEVNGTVVTSTIPAANTSCVLTGLSPGTTYAVKVTAYNTADEWSGNYGGDLASASSANGSVTTGARGVGGGPKGCVLPTDTDGDRLPNAVETNTGVFAGSGSTGTNPNSFDTDGDSIGDGDEVLGTSANLNLPAMGTKPVKQDILLEFDWFTDSICGSQHTHKPSAASITTLKNAFAAAPTVQRDGSTGINLIADYGQGGAFTNGTVIADADGVIAGIVGDPEYNALKAANFAANRNGYFHYVLNPHSYATNSGSSGVAEINGDDLVVSLNCYGTDEINANTIMHELGHNLNLRHGGDENVNYKPNYNSVMNYRFQFNGIDTTCDAAPDHVLSFSVGQRIVLDEFQLSEAAGVCGSTWIDWSGDGLVTPGTVAYDINGDGAGSTLRDHNDWSAIRFTGILDADGASPDGRAQREVIIEDDLSALLPITTR